MAIAAGCALGLDVAEVFAPSLEATEDTPAGDAFEVTNVGVAIGSAGTSCDRSGDGTTSFADCAPCADRSRAEVSGLTVPGVCRAGALETALLARKLFDASTSSPLLAALACPSD